MMRGVMKISSSRLSSADVVALEQPAEQRDPVQARRPVVRASARWLT